MGLVRVAAALRKDPLADLETVIRRVALETGIEAADLRRHVANNHETLGAMTAREVVTVRTRTRNKR